ncbi:thioredoxin family protein [Gramella sp. GC03-9]|uniref:Thioredoxin family protein n=2 Tax=Flavobacteriaceae TaxID=49546 RepID=A0A9X2KY79_9FLAO|nr:MULTISPECIES: thioredoxin family protein [Flavobacteriaceae]MCP9200533.1 thioredoxin family protein [Gramella oceanisediminis]MDT0642623.1 cytochrome c biogenesis protein CcdA [Zunongwangia sp. F363]
MRYIKFLMFLLSIFISSLSSYGQVMDPPNWEVSVDKEKLEPGDTIVISFQAEVPADWYLYSSDFDPELGPMLTEINFGENQSYEVIGDLIPVDPKEKYDELWGGKYTYFTGIAEFQQRIKIRSSVPKIEAVAIYQICSDVTGQCIPFETDLVWNSKKEDFLQNQSASIKDGNDLISSKELKSFKNEFKIEEKEEGGAFLLTFFLLSFGAGLAALLTPCVFPMIPMTVTYFTKSNISRANGISQALLYGFSIILIYTLIGTVFSLLFGADFANFLSTHWLPNLFFFAVFLLFALSFFGLFEIRLPNSFVNKIDAQSNKGGLLGIFFMAFTLVLVGFSCTGPIAGTILLQAANGETIKPLIGMLGFSLAFALPFTLFAIFPHWLKSLPKSGGWLNTVKVVLGFVELALALKFLSIVDQVYHWEFLDRDIYLALWIVIFAFLGFYLLGKIQFPHEKKTESASVYRVISAILIFSFVVYLIPGLFGAPLKPLAGYLPPMSSQNFNMNTSTLVSENEVDSNITNCGTPKYNDLLELPHNIQGYFDYDQALECAQKQNKPIFIDFTGHGCVNCREMEATVWSDPRVLKRLKNDYVVVALYVDEKTELPESEWYVSAHDQKVKKTIGKQNLDFMIQKLNANAQPYYTLVDTSGSLLSAPKGYDLNVENFVEFLDNGLKEFDARQEKNIASTGIIQNKED